MLSRTFDYSQFSKEIWKVYLDLSLFVYLTLFCISYYLHDFSFGELFFVESLIVYTVFLRNKINHYFWESIESENMTAYFFVQFISIFGYFYIVKAIGLIYLSVVPVLVSIVHLRIKNLQNGESGNKSVYLFLMSYFLIGSIVLSLTNIDLISKYEWTFFAGFLAQLFIGVYFLFSSYLEGQRSFILHLVRSLYKNHSDENEMQDKLFFHDLVNQTHGLRLYLEGHQLNAEDIKSTQMGLLISEIDILQNHLANHFGKKHKDLDIRVKHTCAFFSFLTAQNIINTYLPKNRVEVEYFFGGELKSEFDLKGLEIRLDIFHRIILNLVKNVAEYRSETLELTLSKHQEHLCFLFRNPLHANNLKTGDVSKFLTERILSFRQEDLTSRGLGLLSVEEMASKLNGHFSFWVQDGHWHSLVQIPYRMNQNKVKAAA